MIGVLDKYNVVKEDKDLCMLLGKKNSDGAHAKVILDELKRPNQISINSAWMYLRFSVSLGQVAVRARARRKFNLQVPTMSQEENSMRFA